MALMPTDDQLRGLQSVAQSSDGIDAIANKIDGLQCVQRGWLYHQEHRREDGGLLDIWRLTTAGEIILSSLHTDVTRKRPKPSVCELNGKAPPSGNSGAASG